MTRTYELYERIKANQEGTKFLIDRGDHLLSSSSSSFSTFGSGMLETSNCLSCSFEFSRKIC